MDTNLYEKRTNVLRQLTNTFHKGMDTDTSDILLGSDQYRYALNLRITVDGSGTNGELHTINGTQIDEDITEEFEGEQVLAFSTIRNLCVAVLYNKADITWRIVKWDPEIGKDSFVTVFGRSNKPIWETHEETIKDEVVVVGEPILKTLSTVLRWESEKNIKYYIANGVTELLSINLADTEYPFSVEKHPDTLTIDNVYEKAFQYQGDGLPLMSALLTTGGSLKPAIVQYAYRLYIQNGAASDMSPLTKPIYLLKNEYEGYAQTETTSCAVLLTFEETEVTGNIYIQIYRINYQQNGQLPAVDIIADQPFVSDFSVTDVGQSVQSVSAAEFLSELDTHIIPKMIESKGDIMYAANIKDGMEESNIQFSKFDARSYSTGNTYNTNPIFEKVNGDYIENINFDDITVQDSLKHKQFPGQSTETWNKDYWDKIKVGDNFYNGVGKYIKWKYVLNDYENPKYRSGEVYRFGIVLYDKHGKAAPVKWIADIMIPDYYNIDVPESEIHYNYHIGLEFYVDIPKELECSAYDIVRCDRDFNSRYTLFQGIVGFTTNQMHETNACYNPGFFSLDKVDTIPTATRTFDNDSAMWGLIALKEGELWESEFTPLGVNQKILMFACPEYCYNKTLVGDILSSRQNGHLDILIIDRRDVTSFYGDSNKDWSVKENDGLVHVRIKDDFYSWVHSPARNILSGDNISLDNAGLGFKWASTVDINTGWNYRYLMIRAGFLDLQTRTLAYEKKEGLSDGTHESNIPQALSQDDDKALNVFFNWFGQHEYPDDDSKWHNYCSTILDEANNKRSKKYKINKIEYVPSKLWDDFFESGNSFSIKALNDIHSIEVLDTGSVNFINWSIPTITKNWVEKSRHKLHDLEYEWNVSEGGGQVRFSYLEPDGGNTYYKEDWFDLNWHVGSWYPIGGGDDLILLSTEEDVDRYYLYDAKAITSPRIYIANIKQAVTPYGGYDEANIKRSKYYSFGNYVKLQTNQEEDLIHTTIKIGGGDTFVSHFKYNALHWWHNETWNRNMNKMCTIYDTVLETDINLDALYGYLFRTGRGYTENEYMIQNEAVKELAGGYTQSKDSYMYNSGYSCRPNLIPKMPDNKTAGETDTYDTRIQYSNRKTNNETIDSWMDFKSNNFLDVDTRFGEITDLKLFKDKLMFWQNNATGIISTNERTILQNTDDASIILGDGSVLQRFDYISLIYGQKPNQHTACTTNSNLYWWDEYRKEILHYMEGYNVVPLTTVKMIKNYISNRTPVDVPTISYDVDNNEVICHVVYDGDLKDQSLVYNEVVQAFTSIYTFSPVFYAMCMDKMFMIGNDTLYEYGVKQDEITLFDEPATPKVRFIINTASDYTKTFDIQVFGGKFYGGGEQKKIDVRSEIYDTNRTTDALSPLTFSYNTPLKQHASINCKEAVTNAEYDFRLTIPRDGQDVDPKENKFNFLEQWGNRLRGKIMQVELSSNSNSSDFALHYITTKYRISWI